MSLDWSSCHLGHCCAYFVAKPWRCLSVHWLSLSYALSASPTALASTGHKTSLTQAYGLQEDYFHIRWEPLETKSRRSSLTTASTFMFFENLKYSSAYAYPYSRVVLGIPSLAPPVEKQGTHWIFTHRYILQPLGMIPTRITSYPG